MKCSGGHHRWTNNPPSLVTPCLNCGKTWTPPGFRKKAVGPTPPTPPAGPAGIAPPPPPVVPVVSLPDRAERLASALAQLASRAAPAPAPAADVAPAKPPPGPSRFAQHCGQRLARMFDAASDAAIERFRRKPGEADETDLDDFVEAAAEIITIWMPDAELGPYGKLAMASVFVVGGKWVSGEPMTPPIPVTAPGAATNTAATTTPPPAPAATNSEAAAVAPFAVGGF